MLELQLRTVQRRLEVAKATADLGQILEGGKERGGKDDAVPEKSRSDHCRSPRFALDDRTIMQRALVHPAPAAASTLPLRPSRTSSCRLDLSSPLSIISIFSVSDFICRSFIESSSLMATTGEKAGGRWPRAAGPKAVNGVGGDARVAAERVGVDWRAAEQLRREKLSERWMRATSMESGR